MRRARALRAGPPSGLGKAEGLVAALREPVLPRLEEEVLGRPPAGDFRPAVFFVFAEDAGDFPRPFADDLDFFGGVVREVNAGASSCSTRALRGLGDLQANHIDLDLSRQAGYKRHFAPTRRGCRDSSVGRAED